MPYWFDITHIAELQAHTASVRDLLKDEKANSILLTDRLAKSRSDFEYIKKQLVEIQNSHVSSQSVLRATE